MIVVSNLLAMNSNRMLGINSRKKAAVAEKLTSGYQINRAADDAAGLSISEKMRRQIRGLTQGVENTQDGVSLCQVADGALAEVNEMLHRITELAVKAANGTNQEQDRSYIQEEINQMLIEIDRIGDTTTFNEQPIFRGFERVLYNPDGSNVIQGDIPFADFSLADVDLGTNPFQADSHADHLALQAIVNNTASGANGKPYNLIFGNGSTSNSSFRITNSSGQSRVVQLGNLRSTNYFYDDANKTWSRDFVYSENGSNITFTQKVKVEETSASEKNYVISYEVTNNQQANDVRVEFMFHADTAYNNDDFCEGYFVNGNRITEYCIYSKSDSPLTQGVTSPYVDSNGAPDSFSIVDVDNALAFSEKISFDGDKPDSLSIGYYYKIDDWPYYSSLDTELGQNAERTDLGFSLYYDLNLNAGAGETISFKYGIVATAADRNIQNVPVTKDDSIATIHEAEKPVWIQSGCEAEDGLNVVIGEMNTDVLGIRDLNVMTVENAAETMTAVKGALYNIMANRSRIGAQQNRLEHIIDNENNIVENTTAAEARIRDADMAEYMVEYSMQNIMEQVGSAMLSQANQSNQGVLKMLQ